MRVLAAQIDPVELAWSASCAHDSRSWRIGGSAFEKG